MKKSLQIFALLFCIIISAQAPEKFSYQAIIRDASNAVITNAPVGVKISILKTSNVGTVVYAESQSATTNSNGLISLQIGAGSVISGTISGIDWSSDSYYIKTETDPSGGTNYSIAGTTQLLSVPYALYSKNSGSSVTNFTKTGNNIANNNSGNVGIGTGATIPSSLLTVKKNGIGFSQEDAVGATQIGFYTNGNDAYLQTHSNTDLTFSTNNGGARMVLQKTTGNFGIGVTAPTQKLDVNGTTKTVNLQVTAGAGVDKVLTSDILGNATWQDLPNTSIHFASNNGSGQLISGNNETVINSWTGLEETGGANYNAATGEYTVPVTGYYNVMAQVSYLYPNENNSGINTIKIKVDNLVLKGGFSNNAEVGKYCSDVFAMLFKKLTAGQKIKIIVSQAGSTSNVLYNAGTNFIINFVSK